MARDASSAGPPRTNSRRRLQEPGFWKPLLLLVALNAAGMLGYRLTEGWPLVDCLYMSLMVLTTVGFNEIHPLTPAGKWLTIGLMSFGIGLMLYLLTQLSEIVTRRVLDPTEVRRRKERRHMKLKRHTIVCGYGRVGEAVAAALQNAGRSVLVIDQDPERIAWADSQGLATLEADATDESTLHRAGLPQAEALITAMHGDPANLYVVLSARALAPQLTIIARAGSEIAGQKMTRAGADEVINPYQVSGGRIADLLLAPRFTRALSGHELPSHFDLRELPVPETLHGQPVGRVSETTGTRVVALWRGGEILVAHGDQVLQPGDVLLVAGHTEQLDDLADT